MKGDYRRAIHIDFHTLPGIDNMNDFDVDKFAETLAKAHVTYVNVFAQCNQGFCYYPTKIGKVYPGLTRDLLGETVRACRLRGIGVTAYFNAGICVAQLMEHPEWRKVDQNGENTRPHTVGDDEDLIYRSCFNTGYYEFLKSVIREVVDNYNVDGIFCDCFNHEPCYCENCKRDMSAQGIDLNDYAQALAFNDKQLQDFCYDIRNMVAPKHTFFNSMDWDMDFNDHIEHECLPNTPTWSYEYFSPYAAFARGCGKEMMYMTGRFSNAWGGFRRDCTQSVVGK